MTTSIVNAVRRTSDIVGPHVVLPGMLVPVPIDCMELLHGRTDYHCKPAAAATTTTSDPVIYRVGNDDCFVLKPDGSLQPAGWAYSLVGGFVEDLWEEELRVPRSFGRRIKSFRDKVKNAPRLLP